MKVAIIHDWLNGMRGGEKVLEAILELYPHATIYTLFHEPGKVSPFIESHRIVTSWLHRIPGVYRHYRNLLPLFPAAIESWDLREFDLVISSSHAVAKGVRAPGALHICYCHTPMRYAWDAEDDYALGALRRAAFHAVRPRLQWWDCEAAARVDHFIANSRFVQERIREYYGRGAEVIHPPIDTHFFTPSTQNQREDFYLAAGALVPYKRFDVVVQAFNASHRRLVVAGDGPELQRLRRMATPNIYVRGWVTSEELRHLFRTARGVVFAAREDFGMVAVEAQACGCPVIAYGAGGSSETVQDGVNGILFAEQDPDDLIRGIHQFESQTWPLEQVRFRTETFSRESFKTRIGKFVEERQHQNQERQGLTLQPA
jgi:glycosyltransferase involved in cell wall biosynthesis